MPPPYAAGAELLARWTPSHEDIPRWLSVIVIEQVAAPVSVPAEIVPTTPLYRVQTNMGVTMVLPEDQLTDYPAGAKPAEAVDG